MLAVEPTRQALNNGASGISAINTIRSIIDVDLANMQPVPKVNGTKFSTTGGYSGPACLPIALARVNDAAHVIKDEFDGNAALSGIGGIVDWQSAAKHFVLGADTVQICTGIMLHKYEMIGPIIDGLEQYLEEKNLDSISELSGCMRDQVVSFPIMQAGYQAAKERVVVDKDWDPDQFTAQVERLT